MTPSSPGYAAMRLSTDPIPPRERLAVTREVFGRQILNLELEPDPDMALRVDFEMRAIPDLKWVSGTATGVRSRRTPALLSDSNDDLFLSINDSPSDLFIVGHRGRETVLGAGDAVLISCAEPVSFRRTVGRSTGVRVPPSVFAHTCPVVEEQIGRMIPRHSEPLRLLRGYVNSLGEEGPLATPELRHTTASHVHDLLILALDTQSDRSRRAARNGLKAARLKAIKRYVSDHLSGGDLSIGEVARAHGVTERYVQRLFETEGLTFSLFVSHQRLAQAHRLLRDPRRSGAAVSSLAYECGFGDISHFNRMFRRLYGHAPSDLREGGAKRDHA